MSRNNPYSLDFMLKIKQINPNFQFTGVDKENWENFLESQKEDSLLKVLEEDDKKEKLVEKQTPKKKKAKKAKQVIERKNTESLDFFVENENKEESN